MMVKVVYQFAFKSVHVLVWECQQFGALPLVRCWAICQLFSHSVLLDAVPDLAHIMLIT